MKKLINTIAITVLITSSTASLIKNYFTDTTPTQYKETTSAYNVNESNSPAFDNWINNKIGDKQKQPRNYNDQYNSWDSYLHQFNILGNTKGVDPIKAVVGGGVFLNQAGGGQGGPSFLPQYSNDNTIGSFAYKSYSKTTHTKTPVSGGEKIDTNLTVNDLNPATDPDQTNQKKQDTNQNMNKLIDGYLTAILNYWYYTYFGTEIKQSMELSDYNMKRIQYENFYNNVIAKYLNKLLYFKFGAKWNDLEKVTGSENNYEHVAENFVDLLTDGVNEFGEFGGWGTVGSWAFGTALGWLLDAAETHYEVVNHQFQYISEPLYISTIQNIFDEFLGDGTSALPDASIIKQFINTNHVYPDSLTVKNFHFNVQNYSASNETDQTSSGEITSSNTSINTTKIVPNISFDIVADKAAPNYEVQKNRIDNPANGSKANYIPIWTVGKKVPGDAKDWQDDQIKESLDTGWGLGDFADYVSYVPTTLIPNKPVLVKLICPLLGYTKDHPRYFYAEAY